MHRSKPSAAELLLPGAYYARQAATLADGEAMLFGGGGEARQTVVPELSQADLRYAAGGKPPAPYAPGRTPRSGPRRSRRPSASRRRARSRSTTPIRPPTIEEQIVELLRGRRDWLISAEIADALGVQKSTTLARLTELSGGVIRQRLNTRGGRESLSMRPRRSHRTAWLPKWLYALQRFVAYSGHASQQNARVSHESEAL